MRDVEVEVNHFWHGGVKTRSYLQRQFLLMTQLPVVENIIVEDGQGLLKWTNTGYWFIDVAKNFMTILNDRGLANEFVKEHFDYLPFEEQLDALNKSGDWHGMTGS